ncbi:MAG: beta-galactosidase [Terriglobia bacterium]|jgi:beta-galactosidase
MNRRTFNKLLTFGSVGNSFRAKPMMLEGSPAGMGRAILPANTPPAFPPVQFDPVSYRVNGKPAFLYSGEFHYFRVPKADWRERMERFREAGGTCVASYMPWYLHEPEEGKFVFGGESGVLDFEGFLRTAREASLYVIVRPGPYQYTEMKYDGLPGWLCENYPELRAQNTEGKPFRTSSISYVHPLFLEKARKWFDRVAPIIAAYTVSRGGPIAFTQLDNEMTGIHIWNGSLDYNRVSMGFGNVNGRYPQFLRQRFGDIDTLNHAYATHFDSFEKVSPIVSADTADVSQIRRMKDYFDFYLATVAEYAATLARWLGEHGVDAPLTHNSGGPSMNAYFLETVQALGNKTFLLGSDHYYNLDQTWPQNNPTPQYAINIFASLEMLRLMGYPPTVMEMPSGSAADWPPVTAGDCRACYWTHLAFGMKGSNYYIFTGGPNPPGAGTTSDIYDYGAPIGAKNEVRPLYDVQRELGKYLEKSTWLEESERESDCRFALDFEYTRADRYWKNSAGFLVTGGEAWDFFRTGALTSALCASLSPVFCDLRQEDWIADNSTPVVLVSSSSMAQARQERVVSFLKRGGSLLIAPVLPAVDENLQSCTVLRDFLGGPALERNPSAYARVTVLDIRNILDNGENYFAAALPAGARTLGQDENTGRVLAWELTTEGGGHVIFLGLRWLHAMHEHSRMLASLLLRLGLRRRVDCPNPNLWTSLRTAGNHSALFIMNLLTSPQEAEMRCRPRGRSGEVDTGVHKLEPMSVKFLEL